MSDALGRKWLNVELYPSEAEEFRGFLKEFGIKYESSQAGNMVHFECLVDEIDEYFANRFLKYDLTPTIDKISIV